MLVPTAGELEGLPSARGLVELCGFGPVAAAARAAQLIARLAPRRVVLAGIAGTYDAARLPVGAATTFARVALDGVGAGAGAAFQGPRELGFPLLPAHGERPAVDGPLALDLAPAGAPDLLTVCAAARDAGTVARRRARYPAALAEDMEAYGVALACTQADVPLAVVRGISNVAGDPPARWDVPAALAALRATLAELPEGSG